VHRGVRDFVEWVEAHREGAEVDLNPPASTAEVAALEQMLGGPLPIDLKLVLTRFNGGTLPAGQMLPAGLEPATIGATVREYAEAVGVDFLDPELLLPFHRTLEGSLLAFDRSAGPVSDTWPVVDYFEDLDEHRLMFRTFDGWCRYCVAEWSSDDFGAEFSLDTYLRSGQRHVAVEPDVATAHATVAHALKRAGRPQEALEAYLAAARGVPPLHWCDWEALKLACVLGLDEHAYEAAGRLASRAPPERWQQRETSPGRVAEALGILAPHGGRWIRMLEQLADQVDAEEAPIVEGVRKALGEGVPAPPTRSPREEPVVTPLDDLDAWWTAARDAYLQGYLRDDDILLEPTLRPLQRLRPLKELLYIRRDF